MMQAQVRDLHLSRAKLKATSNTSALLAGFAVVSMVELQIDKEHPPSLPVLILFSVVTTLLVIVHLFALMISTCLLPNMDMAASLRNRDAYKLSPHMGMRNYVELAWILSTGIGLILFLFELGLLIWLKFLPLDERQKNQIRPEGIVAYIPAIVSLAILVPASLLFAAFAWRFYTKLAHHRLQIIRDNLRRLEQPSDFETALPSSKKHSTSSSIYPRKYLESETSLDERCQSPDGYRMPIIEEVFETSPSDVSSGYRREDVLQYHDEYGGFNI